MQLYLAAIGRLKKGPEQELVNRYADRVVKTGKQIGLSGLTTIEIVESRARDARSRKQDEAEQMLARLPQNCTLITFDERGETPDSPAFASMLNRQIESGTSALALVIGGPDGLDPEIRKRASRIVSFGAATFPHQLVRVLVLEQVYRTITILTNHPYHRV